MRSVTAMIWAAVLAALSLSSKGRAAGTALPQAWCKRPAQGPAGHAEIALRPIGPAMAFSLAVEVLNLRLRVATGAAGPAPPA
jgi:hypothetical protein